jgi:hypothetical protein
MQCLLLQRLMFAMCNNLVIPLAFVISPNFFLSAFSGLPCQRELRQYAFSETPVPRREGIIVSHILLHYVLNYKESLTQVSLNLADWVYS